jgi:hypothetical protein
MEPTELDIYGIAELAEHWGITKQAAAKRARKMTAPTRLACGPIWTGDQVAAYDAERRVTAE